LRKIAEAKDTSTINPDLSRITIMDKFALVILAAINGKTREQIIADCNTSGTLCNIVRRTTKIREKVMVHASNSGLIGVGVTNYVNARSDIFLKRYNALNQLTFERKAEL